MESNGRKSELMKPILVKVGIPLALSLSGFIYCLITTRRWLHNKRTSPTAQFSRIGPDSQEEFNDQESFHDLNSTSLLCKEVEEEDDEEGNEIKDSLVSLRIRDRPNLEEEILGLKSRVSALQDKERELETRVLGWFVLKEQELVLIELQNMLELEIIHVEFLGTTIESMEAMVVEYLRVVEQLEAERFENGVLQEKVNKLLRISRESSCVHRRQVLVLQAREAEISRSNEEMERRGEQKIKELQDEIMKLKGTVDHLQEENKELVEKLEFGETSASSTSKIEVEETATKDQELVYLRWINACLRHELLKYQEQQRQHELNYEGNYGNRDHNLAYESDCSSTATDHGESCMAIKTISHKKPKILLKLRKWMKGSEEFKRPWDEKEHHQCNYVGRRSVSDVAEEHITARKSCSSA